MPSDPFFTTPCAVDEVTALLGKMSLDAAIDLVVDAMRNYPYRSKHRRFQRLTALHHILRQRKQEADNAAYQAQARKAAVDRWIGEITDPGTLEEIYTTLKNRHDEVTLAAGRALYERGDFREMHKMLNRRITDAE